MAVTAQQLMAAIKKVESGGNYAAHSKTSSASGAYQYIDGTWNGYGGYAHAWQAPPEVQDAKALSDVMHKLSSYGGDARKAAMSWFLPAAVNNPTLAARTPKGNGINPNQYADKVLAAMGQHVAVQSAVEGNASTSTPDDRPAEYKTMEGQLANLVAAISVPNPDANPNLVPTVPSRTF